jgi:rubrerythrin
VKRALQSWALAFAIVVTIAPVAHAEWQPPENPSPTAILREAHADARARRFEDALAKHLWYHENAEKFDAGQTGVRRSFALGSWYDLGADYAPALAKFEEVREAARKAALAEKHPKHVWNAFADYASMSKQLGEEEKIAELFLELRDKNEKHAQKVYRLAERSLLDAERFDVCGEFLDAEREMELAITGYKHNMKLADERFGERHRKFGERSFREGAATIVFILVKNDRADDAKELAQQARDAWDDEKLNEALDQALEGTPPKAFP